MTETRTATNEESASQRQGRPKKRARVISSLTEDQLQHKRNVDRKAQRAFRQRTKDSIERLEQQLASITQTAAESEAKFQQELAAVRESSHTLQQCLEKISELASSAVRSITVNNHNHVQDTGTGAERPTDPPSHEDNNEDDAATNSNNARDTALVSSQVITPVASENDSAGGNAIDNTAVARSNAEGSSGMLRMGTPPPYQQQPSSRSIDLLPQEQSLSPQVHSSIGGPVSSLYDQGEATHHASPTSLASTGPDYLSPPASVQFAALDPNLRAGRQIHYHLSRPRNDELCNGVVISPHASDTAPSVSTVQSVRSNPVFNVLPLHVLPTCPLDEILHNFMIGQRDLISQGVDTCSAAGPPKPTVKALLDPQMTNDVHPLCGIMSEVLSTFAHVNQAEKLAFYYLMYKTMRWQIAPCKESYMAMPMWMRPTVTQITVQHGAWIDNIPWPGVRDILIENPNDHPFDLFSQYYSHNVSVNWPYDPLDAVTDAENEVVLHSIFEKHICNLKNWTVSEDFKNRFPYMSSAIYSRD